MELNSAPGSAGYSPRLEWKYKLDPVHVMVEVNASGSDLWVLYSCLILTF